MGNKNWPPSKELAGKKLSVSYMRDCGQHKKPMDRGSYDYDGTLILVHTSQIGRTWRELEGERSEGFDGLLDNIRLFSARQNYTYIDDTGNTFTKTGNGQDYAILSLTNSGPGRAQVFEHHLHVEIKALNQTLNWAPTNASTA